MSVYEELGRERKAQTLARFLFEKGFRADFAALGNQEWWEAAARMAGVNPPSDKTIKRTLELLREKSEARGSEPPHVAAAPSLAESKGQVESPPAATPSATASDGTPPAGSSPDPVGQASIFDPPYQKHSATSRLAAISIDKMLQKKSHRAIYDLLAERGPLTDEQMQDILGMNPSTQRPRRGELHLVGAIQIVGRGKTKSGRAADLWNITQAVAS